MIPTYATLPLCINPGAHYFTIPEGQSKAVCTRCGLIREQPSSLAMRTASVKLSGPTT